MVTLSQPALQTFATTNPTVVGLQAECKRRGIALFLCGGTVRDLLRGSSTAGDIDFVAETGKDVVVELLALFKSFDAAGRPSVDIFPRKSAKQFALQSDFTVNGFLYDLGNHTVIDPVAGLADLEQGILRLVSPLFLVSSPRAFVRAFRLARELGFKIETATLTTIKNFGEMVHAAPASTYVRLVADFLRLLSFRSLGEPFSDLCHADIVQTVFPQVRPSLQPDSTSPGQSIYSRNIAAINVTETVLTSLPSAIQRLLENEIDGSCVSGADRLSVKTNQLGLIRMSLCFQKFAESYVALVKNPLPQYRSVNYLENSVYQLGNTIKEKLTEFPFLAALVFDAIQRAWVIDKIVIESNEKHTFSVTAFERSDSANHPFLAFHLMTYLTAIDSSQRQPWVTEALTQMRTRYLS